MNFNAEIQRTSRDSIRIRKVSISSSKLKIQKSSTQSKFFSAEPQKKYSQKSKIQQNALIKLPADGNTSEEDSVIMTLNELLQPIKDKKVNPSKVKPGFSDRLFELGVNSNLFQLNRRNK